MLTRVGCVALPTFTEDASPISVIQCRVCGGMGYYVGPDEQGREMAHRPREVEVEPGQAAAALRRASLDLSLALSRMRRRW